MSVDLLVLLRVIYEPLAAPTNVVLLSLYRVLFRALNLVVLYILILEPDRNAPAPTVIPLLSK